MNTKPLTPAEILAAIYRHPDNAGETTIWDVPVVLGTTTNGETKFRIESTDGQCDEVLCVRYEPTRRTYVFTDGELTD